METSDFHLTLTMGGVIGLLLVVFLSLVLIDDIRLALIVGFLPIAMAMICGGLVLVVSQNS